MATKTESLFSNIYPDLFLFIDVATVADKLKMEHGFLLLFLTDNSRFEGDRGIACPLCVRVIIKFCIGDFISNE